MKCVYLRTNVVNEKQYVGQANDFERREYEWNNTNQKYAGAYINNARDKYGLENFKTEILKECGTQDELNQWEQYYIKELNTKYPNGYNLTDGGDTSIGYRFTEEQKKKISESNKGRISPNKGIPMKEETKQKLHNIHKGKRYSPQTEFKKGKPSWNKGKHLSDETKKKLREAHLGKRLTDETKMKMSESRRNNPLLSKQVYQYTLDGKLIAIYLSVSEAKRQNPTFTHIDSCCRGEIKQHKGYIWKYKNDQPN